ncbi:hypothetical protein SAMD00019534_063580, partial [Acytostelium subglobosum LB1]|uniref:hypothetical protein n=1 Tax=Acytostelium subglobosum LB1 TaxID=1410327 RepID=UPI000644B849
LPRSIKSLTCGPMYDVAIEPNALPKSITRLKLGSLFKKSLLPGALPESLKHLDMGGYNLSLEPGIIPSQLVSLRLRKFHERLVHDALPPTLTELLIDAHFNQSLDAVSTLPALTRLELPLTYDHEIAPGHLSPSLTWLRLGKGHTKAPIIPSSLKSLELNCTYFNFIATMAQCPSLTRFVVNKHFNDPLKVGSLPNTLTELDLRSMFGRPIEPGVLPAGLTRLAMSDYYNQPIPPGVLPEGLTDLSLGDEFDQPLVEGGLPASLTRLCLSENFNQDINSAVFPKSITHLGVKHMVQTLYAEQFAARPVNVHCEKNIGEMFRGYSNVPFNQLSFGGVYNFGLSAIVASDQLAQCYARTKLLLRAYPNASSYRFALQWSTTYEHFECLFKVRSLGNSKAMLHIPDWPKGGSITTIISTSDEDN